jgi:hypothetical protein
MTIHRDGDLALSYVPKAFYWVGIALLVFCSLVSFLPYVFPFLADFQGYVMFFGILWAALAFFKLGIPFRVPFPIAMLFLLQAWIAIDGIIITIMIGRMRPYNFYDTYLIRYLYPFFIGTVLTYIHPKSRTIILSIVLSCVGLSVLAGYVQFVAPSLWKPLENLLGPALTGGRPCGLNGLHPHFAILASFAAAILAARAFVRKTSIWETLLFLFFASGSFIAQARTHLPGLAIASVVFLVGLYLHDRKKAVVMTSLMASLLLLAILVFPHRFSILLQTNIREDPNFSARVHNTWPQAEYIQEKLPWTGIGSEPVFAGDLRFERDKWAPLTAFDNGYLLILSDYGYVGAIIMFLVLGGGVWSFIGLRYRKRAESDERTAILVAVGIMTVSVAISMYANNVITWQDAMTFLFISSGLGIRTRDEEKADIQNRALLLEPAVQPQNG